MTKNATATREFPAYAVKEGDELLDGRVVSDVRSGGYKRTVLRFTDGTAVKLFNDEVVVVR